MNKLVVNLKNFDVAILKSGIRVWDKRHEPSRYCGKLSWQEVMDIIQGEVEPASFSPISPL